MSPLLNLELDHPSTGSQTVSNAKSDLARRCLQAAFVLLVVGLVLALLAIWGERRATADAAWRNPADNVRTEAIAPDLALLSLAGVSDDQTLALSIEMGELETTRALLAFSADLTDQQRMNGWLWLAHRYHEAGQTHWTAQAYRMAGLGAILGDELPDLLRVETLLVVGQQLITLHDKPSARFYLEQAATIGARAPRLTAYHRRALLERLIPASARAGGKRDDWIALASKVRSDRVVEGSTTPSTATGQIGWPQAIPENGSELAQAQAVRRAAAATRLAVLSSAEESPPMEAGEKDLQALRQALLVEDAAVEQYVAQRKGHDQTSLNTQEIQLRWLLLKRRIAAGAAGAGLVPQWESSREEIDAELGAAWNAWLALQTSAGPPGSQPVLAAQPALRAIAAAYWGLFPSAPVSELIPYAQPMSGFGNIRLTILEPGTPPTVGWGEPEH